MQETVTSAHQRYTELVHDRKPFLDRARLCSVLTIPTIMPREGHNSHSELPTPFQSLGARGVRTLSSKLLLSMFPTIPFFNYKIDDKTLKELAASEEGEATRGDAEAALASRERAIVLEMESAVFKPVASMVLQHLITTGNSLIYIPPNENEKVRMHRLDSYVVRRDHTGNVLEIIIEEKVDYSTLAHDLQVALATTPSFKEDDTKGVKERPVELYTRIYWDPEADLWKVYQEIGGLLVPGSQGSYKKGLLPWVPLRLITQPGEDYGRSYVEEFLGDLDSLEALSETLVEGSAASARVVFLVSPNGTTDIQKITKAKNGDVIAGHANDVTAMQVQKHADLSVARNQAETIAARLSYAFLLQGAVQRQGERVTAEEIRFMATELDDSLGGIYTLLAAEFQLPIVSLFEKRMEKSTRASPLPKGTVKPVIITGLEAIGRGHDQQNIRAFVAEVIQLLGPELAMRYLNPLEFMRRSAAAYSIDETGLIPTNEEVKQREQQAQMQAMIQHLGPAAIGQAGAMGGQVLDNQMNGGGEQAPPPQE